MGNPYALILMDVTSWCLRDEQCEDFNSCTRAVCGDRSSSWPYEGKCISIPKECSTCGTEILLSVSTNIYPNYLNWRIEDLDANKTYKKSQCLAYGSYMFTLEYLNNDTKADNISFSLQAKNSIIDSFSSNDIMEVEKSFIVCSSDSDCIDYDGCSIDFCDQTTNICKNKNLVDELCTSCEWTIINVTADNYPDETKISLSTKDDNDKFDYILLGTLYDLNYVKKR